MTGVNFDCFHKSKTLFKTPETYSTWFCWNSRWRRLKPPILLLSSNNFIGETLSTCHHCETKKKENLGVKLEKYSKIYETGQKFWNSKNVDVPEERCHFVRSYEWQSVQNLESNESLLPSTLAHWNCDSQKWITLHESPSKFSDMRVL